MLSKSTCEKLVKWFGHVWQAEGNLIKNALIKNLTKMRPREDSVNDGWIMVKK